MGRHAGFYIRKKTFAYFLDDHHGDGIVGVTCKVLPGDNQLLIASDPTKFYMPAYVASKAWIGLRLDLGEIDWEEVKELLTRSYLLVVPQAASCVGPAWRRVKDLARFRSPGNMDCASFHF
jgi:predicted DNA-binding protein (MmcQ/YjbR family)